MKIYELKHGCNPNQEDAFLDMADGSDLPFVVINGCPGYINLMDALNAWQLVREIKEATDMPCAASFNHVSPSSAAIGNALAPELKKACFVDHINELDKNPLACAYVRARCADRMCSFGDWIALSHVCDELTASLIALEFSTGVIAPGYTEAALRILKSKRQGCFHILQIDPDYVPGEQERMEVFGITFHQKRNNFSIAPSLLHNIVTENRDLPKTAVTDLMLSLITLKYAKSNSVCLAYDGQIIGVGAGQQSCIHCTRLAATKADTWFLRQHPKTLGLKFRRNLSRISRDNVIDGYINGDEEDVCADGIWQNYFSEQPERLSEGDKMAWLASRRNVSMTSDAPIPFSDNIKRAFASGVKYIAEPGGSIRDDLVIEECNKKEMIMAFTGIHLFYY